MPTTNEFVREVIGFLDSAYTVQDRRSEVSNAANLRTKLMQLPEAEQLSELINECTIRWGTAHESWGRISVLLWIHFDLPLSGESKPLLRLAGRFLQRCISTHQELAVQFFEGISNWDIFHALESAIPDLSLDLDAARAFLIRVETFAANDTVRAVPRATLLAWVRNHPEVARNLVAEWFDGESSARRLPVASLEYLIEGVVQSVDPTHRASLDWRDDALRMLMASDSERAWQVATYCACFAWPLPLPDASHRHQKLVDFVRRNPRRLVDVALFAIERDAHEFSKATFETLLKLGEWIDSESVLASPEEREKWRRRLFWTASFVFGPRANGASEISGIERLFSIINAAQLDTDNSELDNLFAGMFQTHRRGFEDLLTSFMVGHAQEFVRGRKAFFDVFPHLCDLAKPETVEVWLVDWLVSQSQILRAFVVSCLSNEPPMRLSLAQIAKLSQVQAEAVLHEIVAGDIDSSQMVEMVFALVERHPDLLKTSTTIFRNEIALHYPRTCRTFVEKIQPDSDRPPHVKQLAAEIGECLRTRNDGLAHQQGAPELRELQPSRDIALQFMEWVFSSHANQNSSGTLADMLATRVPIARGNNTTTFSPKEQPRGFQTFEKSVEFSVLEALDPLGVRLASLLHRQRAHELIAGGLP